MTLMWIGLPLTLPGAACSRRAAVSWNARTATFGWWAGEVRLPRGFACQTDHGTDTDQGHFTSPDRRVTVRYDIGGYAGVWAAKEEALEFHERLVEGARIWTAKRDWPDGNGGRTTLGAVTFPDSGCANFFVESSTAGDAAVIDSIARTFRPKPFQQIGYATISVSFFDAVGNLPRPTPRMSSATVQ